MFPSSLTSETFDARKALFAYLMSSASRISVSTRSVSSRARMGAYSSRRVAAAPRSQSEDDLVRLEEVLDRGPHPEEFGVHRELEAVADLRSGFGLEDRPDDVFGRAGQDRALDDHEVLAVFVGQRAAERLRTGSHDREVETATLGLGRGQTEKRNVRVADCTVVRRRAEVRARVVGDSLLETRLVNRCLPGVYRRDDFIVDLDIDYVVADICEAGGDRGADVAAADDGDVHRGRDAGWTLDVLGSSTPTCPNRRPSPTRKLFLSFETPVRNMQEPFGHRGRLAAGVVLLAVLAGLVLWAGAVPSDLMSGGYPDEVDVTPNREAYVGEQVVLGGRVVDTDPVVIATRASGYGRFTLVNADDGLQNSDAPLEQGDRVSAFGPSRTSRPSSSTERRSAIRPGRRTCSSSRFRRALGVRTIRPRLALRFRSVRGRPAGRAALPSGRDPRDSRWRERR